MYSSRLLSRTLVLRSPQSLRVGTLLLRGFSSSSSSRSEFTIPVVDFGRFLNSKTQAEREDAAKQVVDALVERGFMVSL